MEEKFEKLLIDESKKFIMSNNKIQKLDFANFIEKIYNKYNNADFTYYEIPRIEKYEYIHCLKQANKECLYQVDYEKYHQNNSLILSLVAHNILNDKSIFGFTNKMLDKEIEKEIG